MPFQFGSVIDGWKSPFPFHCLCSSGHFCHPVKAAIKSGSSRACMLVETARGALVELPALKRPFGEGMAHHHIAIPALTAEKLMADALPQARNMPGQPKTSQLAKIPLRCRAGRWGDPKLEWEDMAKLNSFQTTHHLAFFAFVTFSAVIKQSYFCGYKTGCVLQCSPSEWLRGGIWRWTTGTQSLHAAIDPVIFQLPPLSDFLSEVFHLHKCLSGLGKYFLLIFPNPYFFYLLLVLAMLCSKGNSSECPLTLHYAYNFPAWRNWLILPYSPSPRHPRSLSISLLQFPFLLSEKSRINKEEAVSSFPCIAWDGGTHYAWIWDANMLVSGIVLVYIYMCAHALNFHHSDSYQLFCLLEQTQEGFLREPHCRWIQASCHLLQDLLCFSQDLSNTELMAKKGHLSPLNESLNREQKSQFS